MDEPTARPQPTTHVPAAPSGVRPRIGARGERLAELHLRQAGLEIVARNWRIAEGDLRGELDLVALDHAAEHVVIVEVKTRTGTGYGGPLAAVTPRKQQRIRRLALRFVLDAALPYRQVRFDVVAVTIVAERVDLVHLQGAF